MPVLESWSARQRQLNLLGILEVLELKDSSLNLSMPMVESGAAGQLHLPGILSVLLLCIE